MNLLHAPLLRRPMDSDTFNFFAYHLVLLDESRPSDGKLPTEHLLFIARALHVFSRADLEVAGKRLTHPRDIIDWEYTQQLERRPNHLIDAAAFILAYSAVGFRGVSNKAQYGTRVRLYDLLASRLLKRAATISRKSRDSKTLYDLGDNYTPLRATTTELLSNLAFKSRLLPPS